MSNWFPIGKDGANTTYTDKGACELAEGQECFEVSNIDSSIAKVIEVDVEVGRDELDQPIIEKQKQVIVDEVKLAEKEAKRLEKEAKKNKLADKLVALKANGHKDVQDLIEILGL